MNAERVKQKYLRICLEVRLQERTIMGWWWIEKVLMPLLPPISKDSWWERLAVPFFDDYGENDMLDVQNSVPFYPWGYCFSWLQFVTKKRALGGVDQNPSAWQPLRGYKIHKKLVVSLCHVYFLLAVSMALSYSSRPLMLLHQYSQIQT